MSTGDFTTRSRPVAVHVEDSADRVRSLLAAHRRGDRKAFRSLVPYVYPTLRRIAHVRLRRAQPGNTLNTTALVHDAYIRLAEASGARWESLPHFLAVAAAAMRQIIVDHVRRRAAQKRGGGLLSLHLDDACVAAMHRTNVLIDLDDALRRLDSLDWRLSRVVECRFFAGLTEMETAEALGMSLRSVQRTWMQAKSWLRRDLKGTCVERRS